MQLSDNQDKQKALDLAEDSRETEWRFESFVGELFKGNFRWDLIHPYPTQSESDKAIGDQVLAELEKDLKAHINPDQIDTEQHVPKEALKALGDKGYFGMKIAKEYGGMGLSVENYTRAMALVGSWCGSTAVWLSAHQSIGVPQPLKLFGTHEQKEKYLPRLAKGDISAFALTEPDVGSDPARMTTTATPTEDGNHYILNGNKLYCTNGPEADVLVVMALTPPKLVNGKEKQQITAFIVESNTPGFEVVHRSSFMGIRGIANGHLRFTNVKVPKENIIGGLGQGLKIAFVTLNAGRLTIPAISAASGKWCLEVAKKWSNERVQWGAPIGEHQAVAQKLATMAADTFAMESVSSLTATFADQANADIRLEAAMAKYFCSEKAWTVADETLQIRGGRGFETASSLQRRGEAAYPVERVLRDLRINRIIEGTSEVMQLFIAREAMDTHVRRLMGLMNPKASLKEKLKLGLDAFCFYALWYPKQWVSLPKAYGTQHLNCKNRKHLRFIHKTSKKLARSLFHTMALYQTRLEKEQLLLAQFVDIGTDLFAMASSLSRAEALLAKGGDETIQDVVDLFCRQARKRIRGHFKAVCCNSTRSLETVSKHLLKGKLDWMIHGIIKP
ncbi:MAG: acyl-CoA dehydrogenase family protein [Candidatus Margulisiibacteriota bacterium]